MWDNERDCGTFCLAAHFPTPRDLFGSDDSLLTAALRGGLEGLYDLFQQAPDLGSLIDPSSIGGREQADGFQLMMLHFMKQELFNEQLPEVLSMNRTCRHPRPPTSQ